MNISLLDLSRGAREPAALLQGLFPGALISHISKSEWKKLGAMQLIRAARALPSAVFVLAVDDIRTAQDLTLLQALAVASRVPQLALLEVGSGNLHYFSRSGFLFLTVPRMCVDALASLAFAGVFRLAVGILDLAARRRSATIGRGYSLPAVFEKVAYLKSDLSLNILAGGSIAHTRGVIGGLLSNGKNVSIIANEAAPWLRFPDVPLQVVRPVRWFSFWRETERMVNGIVFGIRAARLLRLDPPRLVYQRKALLDISGVIVSLWLGIPLVVEANDCTTEGLYWERPRFRRLAAATERLQMRAATVSVCVSQPLFEIFGRHGFDTARIEVILNGVDVEKFDTDESRHEAVRLRASRGVPDTHTVVGFVGTFGQWHGIHTLTEGMIQLVKRRPDVPFLLIGDGELKSKSEIAVQEAGVADRVEYVGLIPASQVAAHLASCDILVSPHSRSPDGSKFIGSPTKLFEYMAARRAIVASNLDQIGEILAHGKSALLFEPDSVPGFVEAVERLVDDRNLRSALADASRALVTAKYTWHANVSQLLARLARARANDGDRT